MSDTPPARRKRTPKPAAPETTVAEAAPAVPAETTPAPPVASKPTPDRRSALALTLKRTMSQGDAGPQVKQAQEALAKAGFFDATQDGHYGSRMARAVRQFQSARGIRVTGDINPTTWEELIT